jgi:serine/threonine-protein kinase
MGRDRGIPDLSEEVDWDGTTDPTWDTDVMLSGPEHVSVKGSPAAVRRPLAGGLSRTPTPTRVVHAPSFPQRLGAYSLVFPIGAGSTATVFLARTPSVDGAWREVALKLYHPHIVCSDPALRQRIVREARLVGWIHHPNVATLIDVGESPHGVYLVMDYIEGGTLSSLLRTLSQRGRLVPIPVGLRIAFDMLEGLQAVHDLREESGRPLGVVHRDVSPKNVLVSLRGTCKLIDLGIAKVPSWTQVTVQHRLVGKAQYLSPEQVLGHPLDHRSDVWSAGVTVWESLAGRALHPGNELRSLIERLHAPAPRLREVRPDVPEALDEAIASALTPDLASRCPTAAEFLSRLRAAWLPSGQIANVGEVGDLVTDCLGAELQERREAVRQLLEYRETMSRIEASALEDLADDQSVETLPRGPRRVLK